MLSHEERIAEVKRRTAEKERQKRLRRRWIAAVSGKREWLGQRQIKNLTAAKYTITNRLFESTVSVKRTSIEDDRLGVYKPAFAELGGMAKRHPDQMIFDLLKAGFATRCYDGEFFFDTDHRRGRQHDDGCEHGRRVQRGPVPAGHVPRRAADDLARTHAPRLPGDHRSGSRPCLHQ